MKYTIRLYFFISLIAHLTCFSQVGISTTDPKASLDVVGSGNIPDVSDGIIAPRLTKAELIAKTSYGAAQTGALIYITDSSGVSNTDTQNVATVGYYFFDGTIWQRVTTGRGDNIYTANGDVSPTIATNREVTFSNGGSLNIDANTLFIDANGNKVGIGTNLPNAKLDIRQSPSSVSDPGEGMFGIGTTASSPVTSGSGAMRYNTISGGVLQYSNGVTWNTLTSTVQKSVAAGNFQFNQLIPSGETTFLNLVEDIDVNNDLASNQFVVPRTGLYQISCTITSRSNTNQSVNQETSIRVAVNGVNVTIGAHFSETNRTGHFSVSTTGTFQLTVGDIVRFSVYRGSSTSFRVHTATFNKFSIVEL